MKSERGNVLVYILIGVALFAALSYTMTRNVEGGSNTIDDEQATLLASQLINHAQQTQQTVQQMLMTGSTIEDIDFVKPGEAGYTTAPHQHKVFHPSGGGMNVFNDSNEALFSSITAISGWQSMTAINVEWTETTAVDILYSFVNLESTICSKINKLLTGSETVASTPSVDRSATFQEGGGDDANWTTANCTACEGNYSLCIAPTSGPTFYNVIASQ